MKEIWNFIIISYIHELNYYFKGKIKITNKNPLMQIFHFDKVHPVQLNFLINSTNLFFVYF